MSEHDPGPDPELEGRLQAAFKELRPRPDFERALAGRLAAERRAPWRGWAVAAAAAVVVAGGGLGLYASMAHRPAAVSTASRPLDQAQVSLPVPALVAPAAPAAAPSGGAAAQSGAYAGPFSLRWAGTLPDAPAQAAVYRYSDFTEAQAAPLREAAAGASVSLSHPDPRARSEARFSIAVPGSGAGGIPSGSPADLAAADAFAGAHRLPVDRASQPEFDGRTVLYPRSLAAGTARLPVWTAAGVPDGVRVRFSPGGGISGADGPLAGQAPAGSQPLRSPAAALQKALAQSSAGAPELTLTGMRLVYIPAPDPAGAGAGYLEPVYLLSGTLTRGAQAQTQLVLVPAVASIP